MKRKSIFFVLCCLLFSLFVSDAVMGCKIAVRPPNDIDTTKHVFIGEVIGYVEAKYSKPESETGIKGNAFGLNIKVKENIYSSFSASSYHVFPLKLTAFCGLESYKDDELQEKFPIGSEVRVIASIAERVESNTADNVVRLEASIRNSGSVSRNDLSEKLKTSDDRIYDYKNYDWRKPVTQEDYDLLALQYSLPNFELLKDFLRLKKSKTENEKLSILERLIYFPQYLDFETIVKRNVTSAKISAELIEKRKAWWLTKYPQK